MGVHLLSVLMRKYGNVRRKSRLTVISGTVRLNKQPGYQAILKNEGCRDEKTWIRAIQVMDLLEQIGLKTIGYEVLITGHFKFAHCRHFLTTDGLRAAVLVNRDIP